MKVIIAGSRTLHVPVEFINWAVNQSVIWDQETITEVVCGCASGIDSIGAKAAKQNNIPVKEFPADWDTYGKAAGHIRNKQMAEYADALLLIWDGESKGSANMKRTMEQLNKPICEIILKVKDE